MKTRIHRYFSEDVWGPPPSAAGLVRRGLRRLARFLYLVVSGFLDDRVLVQAPALTFTTLLAIVPLLALSVVVATGMGFRRDVMTQVRSILEGYLAAGQQDVVQVIVGYVERTNFGALGSIGLLFLMYASVRLLSTIERAFNDIWGVERNRPFHRRVTDYLTIVIVFPVLLIASSGLTAGLSSIVLTEKLRQVALLSGAMELGLQFLPFLVLGAGFAFLYKYMPYTTVQTRTSLIAGFLTGVLWHGAQWAFIQFQIGVTQNNIVYGTFAALPIFLIWLNTSWIIVLVGCEVAYAIQHEATYSPPAQHQGVSIARREQAALQLLGNVWQRFVGGQEPLAVSDLAAEIDLPRPVTVEILRAMLDCGLLAHAATPEDGLLPARDFRHLSVGEILIEFRHAGRKREDHERPGDPLIVELHERLERAVRNAGTEEWSAVFPPP